MLSTSVTHGIPILTEAVAAVEREHHHQQAMKLHDRLQF